MTKITRLVNSPYCEIVSIEGNFNDAKKDLQSKDYRIASAEEIAKYRMKQGRDSEISRVSARTCESFIYVPQYGAFLTKDSPIIRYSEKATRCHSHSREFCLSEKRLDKLLFNSVQVNENAIPTNRFGENEVTTYLFGKIAQEYGEFLRESGITQMPIWLASMKERRLANGGPKKKLFSKPAQQTFARQLSLWELSNQSALFGDNRGLNYDANRTFGIK
jgi:hypothetical protein